ncbi:MAG: hypothetical protein AAGG50_20680 [Bacteroidota bacterium]
MQYPDSLKIGFLIEGLQDGRAPAEIKPFVAHMRTQKPTDYYQVTRALIDYCTGESIEVHAGCGGNAYRTTANDDASTTRVHGRRDPRDQSWLPSEYCSICCGLHSPSTCQVKPYLRPDDNRTFWSKRRICQVADRIRAGEQQHTGRRDDTASSVSSLSSSSTGSARAHAATGQRAAAADDVPDPRAADARPETGRGGGRRANARAVRLAAPPSDTNSDSGEDLSAHACGCAVRRAAAHPGLPHYGAALALFVFAALQRLGTGNFVSFLGALIATLAFIEWSQPSLSATSGDVRPTSTKASVRALRAARDYLSMQVDSACDFNTLPTRRPEHFVKPGTTGSVCGSRGYRTCSATPAKWATLSVATRLSTARFEIGTRATSPTTSSPASRRRFQHCGR